MVRVMRFFQIFRDVVRRSSDLLPALIGPLTLVMTMLHVFVYGGMALWGGAIEVGKLGEAITPLYDLNNFNTYLVSPPLRRNLSFYSPLLNHWLPPVLLKGRVGYNVSGAGRK